MLVEFLSRNLTYDTVKTYKSVLIRFLKHLDNLQKDINTLDEKTLIEYTQAYKPATHNKIVTIVRSYYNFATGKTLEIENLKYNNFQESRLITINEVKTLLKYTPTERETLIIKMLFQTGLRVAELARMKKENITKEEDKYYLFFISKGSKQNKKEIPTQLALELLKFESHKKTLLGISKNQIIHIVGKLSKEILGKKITPHGFRHGYATELFNQGATVEFIKEKLGHTHTSTTMRYIHNQNNSSTWSIEL